MKEIRMLLHIPDYQDDCALAMLYQIRHLVEVISSSHAVMKEWWQVDFDDDKNSAAVYTNDVQMGEYWNEEWEAITEGKIAQVSSVIQYKNQRAKGKLSVGISGVLVPSAKYYKLPRNNGERWISLSMTQSLWRELDQRSFVQCVKEVYCALKSTYVCIDEEAPIGGIYEASFRLLTDSPSVTELENKLPGIYWFQIVSCDFLSNMGDIRKVMKNVPCEHVELIEAGQQRALLLQLSSRIRDGSRKKRLALREYFKESLYSISLDNSRLDELLNINHFKYMCVTHQKEILRMLRMIPLTDDEICEIIEMSSTVE